MLKLIMKKIILGLFLFIAAVFITVFFVFNNKKSTRALSIQIIDGKLYKLIEARSPQDWIKGLMYYKSKKELNGADGMIFIFPEKEIRSFWNENTYLDLDLYWMDGETVVGKSYLPSILRTKKPFTVNSPGEVDRVVEIVRY